ncbi:MAG TPA: response regulator [Longimicrobiaceae bacterium]|nr:response regulator [Longimicrobiaceae bacterium]
MSGEGANLPLILLVEDNEAIRNAFAILLRESGYRVIEVASGSAAIETSATDRPDLILLDLGLPDVGGLEVARALRSREETRETPIVALTGRALETDAEACYAAGCTGYLTKPIDTEQLLRVLPTYLNPQE